MYYSDCYKRGISITLCIFIIITVCFSNFIISEANALALSTLALGSISGVLPVILCIGSLAGFAYMSYKGYDTYLQDRLRSAVNNLTDTMKQKWEDISSKVDTSTNTVKVTPAELNSAGLNVILGSLSAKLSTNTKLIEDTSAFTNRLGTQTVYTESQILQNWEALKTIEGRNLDISITYKTKLGSVVGNELANWVMSGYPTFPYVYLVIQALNSHTGQSVNFGVTLLYYNDTVSMIAGNFADLGQYTWQKISTIPLFTSTNYGYVNSASNGLAKLLGYTLTAEEIMKLLGIIGEGSICYSPPVIKDLPSEIPVPQEITIGVAPDGGLLKERTSAPPIVYTPDIPGVRTLNPDIDSAISNPDIVTEWPNTIVVNPPDVNIPDPDYTVPDVTLDFGPLILGLDTIKTKFPFSIPWDFYNSIKALQQPAVVPKFEFEFPSAYFIGGGKVEVEFSAFEGIAKILRYFITLAYVVFLITRTRSMTGSGD